MPRKAIEVVKEESVIEEEVLESKAGIVMIDDEYYFKIVQRQYVLGKKTVNKDGADVYNDKLYPDTIEGVFKLYFKELLVKKTAGKVLGLPQLLDVVNEIKSEIAAINAKLS